MKFSVGDRVKYKNSHCAKIGIANRSGTVVTSKGYILPDCVGVRWDDQDLEFAKNDPELLKHIQWFGTTVNVGNLTKLRS